MSIIKNYHDKKWILQFLDALYNSIDIKRSLFLFYNSNDSTVVACPQKECILALQASSFINK
jgi:hypothetical protein